MGTGGRVGSAWPARDIGGTTVGAMRMPLMHMSCVRPPTASINLGFTNAVRANASLYQSWPSPRILASDTGGIAASLAGSPLRQGQFCQSRRFVIED